MQLSDVLDNSVRMEERAAALYRRFSRETPAGSACAGLWEAMALEETEHATSVRDARRDLPSTCGWRVHLDGWTEAMRAMDDRLARAERLPATATDDERIAAAFDIELGEMDALRHAAIGATHGRPPEADDDHLGRLANVAARCSSDPHVLAQATIARTRRRLQHAR